MALTGYLALLGMPMLVACPAAAQTAPAASATPAPGEEPPIEITADELTVRQGESIAVFRGAVDAVQGDVTLKTDLLRVFYTTAEGQTAGGAGTDVDRLEAEGNVLVTRPDRTAAGDRGTYDLTTRKVVLLEDVVLTNAGNVIRGGRLDWDLATDVAVVTPEAGGEERGGRVRALFGSQGEAAPGPTSGVAPASPSAAAVTRPPAQRPGPR